MLLSVMNNYLFMCVEHSSVYNYKQNSINPQNNNKINKMIKSIIINLENYQYQGEYVYKDTIAHYNELFKNNNNDEKFYIFQYKYIMITNIFFDKYLYKTYIEPIYKKIFSILTKNHCNELCIIVNTVTSNIYEIYNSNIINQIYEIYKFYLTNTINIQSKKIQGIDYNEVLNHMNTITQKKCINYTNIPKFNELQIGCVNYFLIEKFFIDIINCSKYIPHNIEWTTKIIHYMFNSKEFNMESFDFSQKNFDHILLKFDEYYKNNKKFVNLFDYNMIGNYNKFQELDKTNLELLLTNDSKIRENLQEKINSIYNSLDISLNNKKNQ
jgi:hypothetical protein